MIVGVSVLAAALSAFDSGPSLVGEWKGSGAKTVESMQKAGMIKKGVNIEHMIGRLSETTYIFTKDTLKLAIDSGPYLGDGYVSYEVTDRTDNSISISLYVTPDDKHFTTYYFTEDGQCIYTEQENYKDFFCKPNGY